MRRLRNTRSQIEKLIAAERWTTARKVIRDLLVQRPDDHWLLSRMALTYYEQRAYAKAMALDLRAVEIQPTCPLALWGLAGALDMLGQEVDASELYRRLIRRGPRRLATGRCGEGMRWANGLVADCWFRLGQIRVRTGRHRGAIAAFRRHLALRRFGSSIYSATQVRSRLREFQGP
jgi:tetratricopeptide (TPR) repeat protein